MILGINRNPRIFDAKYGAIIRSTFTTFLDNIKLNDNKLIYPNYNRSDIVISEIIKNENSPPEMVYKKQSYRSELINIEDYIIYNPDNGKQKYFMNGQRRIPISDFELNTNIEITDEQWNFAIKVIKENKLRSKIDTISNSYELYKYLYDLFYKNSSDIESLKSSFPFINNEQKVIFIKFKGSKNNRRGKSSVKKYMLSDEERSRLKALYN